MEIDKNQLRKIIKEEIEIVLSEMDVELASELPNQAREHVRQAQYHLDQAQSELLGTKFKNEQIFDNLSKADRLLKKYLR